MDVQTRCDISRMLKIDVKLLLKANRKSYMPRRLTQQQMTLSDLEWLFHALCAISAEARLVVWFTYVIPSPPLDNIRVMVIVWKLGGNIIRTALCWIV